MAIKQKKPEPVVFDNPEDLLVAMIRGRHFEYKGITYSFFNKETAEFRWDKENGKTKPIAKWGVIQSIPDMCNLLVGYKLKDVDPISIEVDTLLEVSDGSKKAKRYFSHWDKGRLYAFKNGTTSLTNDGVFGWSFWKFANPTDSAKEAK